MPAQLPIRSYASAGGVVIDSTGQQVLVLRRPGRQRRDGDVEVRLPKGHIEPGESRDQAALREVGEETGLTELEILADLGSQVVEFDWRGHHYIRHESCFLMSITGGSRLGRPEKQFECLWLTWEMALASLTYEAEQDWVRKARGAWLEQRSQYVPDEDA